MRPQQGVPKVSSTNAAWSADSAVIPRDIFVDPEIYKAELQRIFKGPTWHLVAHESEMPAAGDYKRSSIADVPIFVVRGQDGILRGFVNACAHRGTELANRKRGNTSNAIRCIYHGWRYELNGKLRSVPLPEGFPEGFKKEDHGLTPIRVESFRGCVFATLHKDTLPLQRYLGDKICECIADALGEGNLIYLGSQSMTFRCNWKLYAENIVDSYHPDRKSVV